MKIYVITEGCYSDYRICAVTDDADKAERLRMSYSSIGNQAYIEIFDTDDVQDALNKIPVDAKACVYKVLDDGVGKLRVYRPVAEQVLGAKDYKLYQSGGVNVDRYSLAGVLYETIVRADSEEEAKKIAAERIAPVRYERMSKWASPDTLKHYK